MPLNSNDIFSRLLKLYEVEKMNELSEALGFKKNWAASTRNRGGIPFDACVIASEKFDVTMDYLLFGSEVNQSIEEKVNKLRKSVTDGIFWAIQTGAITPGKDISISYITEVIMDELRYVYQYNNDEAKLMNRKLMEEMNIKPEPAKDTYEAKIYFTPEDKPKQ